MPVILLCVIIFCIWLRYEISKSSGKETDDASSFWDKESKANKTRKKDISHLNYITISLDKLPLIDTDDEHICKLQSRIKTLSTSTIVNLNGISNTDLKLEYGAPNLPFLTACDQNFLTLVRTLQELATVHYNAKNISAAKALFEFAIECGSDITKTFCTLADIYKEEHNAEGIKMLTSKAENLTSLTKNTIVSYLQSIS